jgi:hypothetical protein
MNHEFGGDYIAGRAGDSGVIPRRYERAPERSWPEPAGRRIDEPENQPKGAA